MLKHTVCPINPKLPWRELNKESSYIFWLAPPPSPQQ